MTEQDITLVPIERARAFVLENLFELYAHDFSEQLPLELAASGRFEVPIDERWWSADDHFPFFVHAADKLVGFALVRRGSRVTQERDVMDVAEFFVVRGARRRGVGQAAAHALFARFAGRWEIRVRLTNTAANGFWRTTCRAWLGHEPALTPFSAKGVEWQRLSLDTAREPRGTRGAEPGAERWRQA